MPQSSSKRKKKGNAPKPAKKNYKNAYIIAIIVVAIVIASGGFYVYSTAHTTTAYIPGSNISLTSDSTLESSTASGLIYAKIATSQGTIEVELFQNETPKTVDNFVSLVNSGFYTNLVWHRIVRQSGFDVIQTGDPSSRSGQGDPCTWGENSSTKTVPLEIVPSLHNDVGYLGVARTSDPNSGSSQFYINLTNNNSLDGSYTVFGLVISGLSVAQAIDNLPINGNCQGGSIDGPPQNPSLAMIKSITIQTSP